MSQWSSRPRQTPFAGHRKATSRWCVACGRLHRTHRSVGGEELCPHVEPIEKGSIPLLPHIRASKKERAIVRMDGGASG